MGLSGLGGNDHFAAIQFAQAANIELNPVPFSGAAIARTSIMGGHVAMGTMAFSQTVGFEEDLRVLAVFTDERLPQAPKVPTAKELGFDAASFEPLVMLEFSPHLVHLCFLDHPVKYPHQAYSLAAAQAWWQAQKVKALLHGINPWDDRTAQQTNHEIQEYHDIQSY